MKLNTLKASFVVLLASALAWIVLGLVPAAGLQPVNSRYAPAGHGLLDSLMPSAHAQGLTLTFANSIVNAIASTCCASSTAENTLQVVTLPPGALNGANRAIDLVGDGTYTLGANTPTMTLKVKLSTLAACTGGTTLTLANYGATAALATGITNVPFRVKARIVTATPGSSGTLWAHGEADTYIVAFSSTAAVTRLLAQTTAVSSAIDLTQQLFLCTSGTLSTSNASNLITERNTTVTPLNFSF